MRLTTITVLLTFFATTSVAGPAAQSALSPDGVTGIEWRCKDDSARQCDVIVKRDQQHTKVWSGVPAPTVTWHSKDLAEIRIGCGAPCFYSKFYSRREGISEPIEFVMAVSPDNTVAVRAVEDALEVVRIFGKSKPVARIRRDFSQAATLVSVLNEVRFIDDRHLLVRYLSGEDYVEKTETVALARK